MKARKVRRWVVGVLAVASVAAGVFASTATSTASDIDWNAPVSHTVAR
jgi:hypothetical protein